MRQSLAVCARHVSKRFYIVKHGSNYQTMREALGNMFGGGQTPRHKRRELWALDDVSFAIKRQDRFAIVGLNGAGKSTLLKILSRVLYPTSGKVLVAGRVVSLLELGTGFHPDLSGRDNIYLNGSILGMARQEIRAVYNDILEFSEIERFIDTPIKFYSSGMQARLGFAVAAHLNADILIIDEVLSVGDYAFQQKCVRRMHEICQSGRTILFVSHNMDAIKHLCNRAMLLSGGRVQCIGEVDDVVDEYEKSHRALRNRDLIWIGEEGDARFRIHRLEIVTGTSDGAITSSTPLRLIVEYELFERISDVIIGIDVINSRDHQMALSYCPLSRMLGARVSMAGRYCLELALDFSLFTGGNYTIAFWARTAKAEYILHHHPRLQLFVDGGMQLAVARKERLTAMPDGIANPAEWRWSIRR